MQYLGGKSRISKQISEVINEVSRWEITNSEAVGGHNGELCSPREIFVSVEYTISGSDTYNKYKEKVGQIAIGALEIRTYDDGTVKYDITALE